ncbi:MAG: amidase [Polaromonas sp. 24-63-21]|uniref:amidase family protein n=1 Tax=Polaromonas sp. 24-63-21 TaxID=1970415 RepID=UPI000BD1A1A5|nr:amidase family protein [Polaromonas sp. 24-63-21]OYZ77690.1 MAG: amidase [Polaromonas sp. 24-63-21]
MARLSLPHTCSTLVAAAALSACSGPGGLRGAPDIDSLTATEAAVRICSGTLSSEALVQAYLLRAKSRPELNAFVTLDETGALQAARAADQRRAGGGACLPLQGVPIVVKDNIQARGLPATAGTPALKNFVPTADAPVLQKLRDAGAIVLGKTNLHELAFGISGYNPAFNTGPQPGVRNAYDVTKMAGGSSAGMGRYPQAGIAPISHTRDTAGPMAVAMADVELLDRVVTGAPALLPADLKAVRLGVVPGFLANLDSDTRGAWETSLARLKAAGVTVVDVAMPQLAELNGKVGFPVALYEAYDDMVAYLARYNTGVSIRQMAASIASPDVKGTYDALVIPRKLPGPNGLVDAAPIYQAAMTVHRPALVKLYADTFAGQRLDALVFPTVPRTALPATPEASSLENFGLFIQNTDPGSNAGIPGIQLPMGLGASSRMPTGLELDGPAGSDRRLIAIGLALEKVLGRLPAAR